MSEVACEVLKITTGMVARTGSARTSESTSLPVLRGRFRSSTTRSGAGDSRYLPCRRKNKIASVPSSTELTCISRLLRASASLVRSISAGLSSTNSTSGIIFVAFIAMLGFPGEWLNRESEMERAAVTWLRFKPDTTTMVLDDLLADRQADTAAGIFRPGVQAFENSEDNFGVFGSDADSVVGDQEHPLPVLFFPGDANHRRGCAAKFDGVGDQVLQDLHQLRFVRGDYGELGANHLRAALGDRSLKIL